MVGWTWQNPSPALALGFSSVEQQPGLRSLVRRYGGQRVAVCRREEKKRRSVVLAAKRGWEEIWEPRAVSLDESDMATLELRSLLGEPHDLSVAKLVAKKLNPSATNLEVEKIVKQKGTKTFLSLLKKNVQEPALERKPEGKPGVTKEADAGSRLPLSPKPSGLQAPPRRPGYVPPVRSVPEWPDEADAEMSRDYFRRLGEPDVDVRRKAADETIQLSPRPRGATASPSSGTVPRYSEPVTPSVKKEATQPVPKPVPELTSRPARGGAADVFPGLKKAAPPKKNLPVPSLSVRPEVRLPPPPTVPEETSSPTLEVKAPAAPRVEPGLVQKPINQKRTESETTAAESLDQQGNVRSEPTEAFRYNEPDLLSKPVSSTKVTDDAENSVLDATQESAAAIVQNEPDLLNKPVSFQSPKLTEDTESNSESSARAATEESFSSSVREEPALLSKPLSQILTDTAQSNGSANVEDETEYIDKDELRVHKPVTSATEPSRPQEQVPVLPVLNKPLIRVEGGSQALDKLTAQKQDEAQVRVLASDEAVSLRRPDIDAARENTPESPRRPELEPDVAEVAQKDVRTSFTQEEIERDWALAEAARDTQTVQDVVFIGSNAGGMIVRFGCLNGFLPGKELLESRGLKTFRSWARSEGHYVNHTSVLDTSDGLESTYATSKVSSKGLDEDTENHSLHPACEEDINLVYRQHRTSLLSSLVGERSKVMVTTADKAARKLVFSEKKAVLENPDVVERRIALMSKLKSGDVVNGKVRNISLFGVFVELVDGVSGLIRFSELSWSPVPDPTKVVNVGEEIEAVVQKLDHEKQHIYLSLKRMSPDPLLESVESMLARDEDGTSEVTIVPEFEDLIKRLESRKEIQGVVKGRRLHSAAVVSSFQVYLSSTLPEGYKLLARLGNEVQEVLVQTTIERDSLISIIRELTS